MSFIWFSCTEGFVSLKFSAPRFPSHVLTIQKVLKLSDGSAVLYTVAKYFTPDMVDITKKGIEVDIDLEIPSENIEIMKKPDYIYSFETDYQLQRAIDITLKDIKSQK